MEENIDDLNKIKFENMNEEKIFEFLYINKKDEELKLNKKKNKKLIKLENIDKHNKIVINNENYYFPFPPYESQISFCKSVIESIISKRNCSLQSPTGTGKTMSLLISTLGYLYNHNSNYKKDIGPKRIIYLSRTHSQLNQVCSEIKKIAYKPITTMLASRDKYCIKSEWNKLKGHNKQLECNNAIKNRNCIYFIGNENRSYKNISNYEIQDMEDLLKNSKEKKFCPYYYNKKKSKDAHLILMPYNYLTDDLFRNLMTDLLNDSILIIDEAHNFPTFLENGGSYSLNTEFINSALIELKHLRVLDIKYLDFNFLYFILNNLLEKLKNIEFNNSIKEKTFKKKVELEKLLSIEILFNFYNIFNTELNNHNINEINKKIIVHYKILEDITSTKDINFTNLNLILLFLIKSKSIIINILKSKLNNLNRCDLSYKYKLYCKRYDKLGILVTELNIWCLNPSIVMNKILNINFNSIIFTSGTLGNISTLEKETNLNLWINKEFPHVIDIKTQLYIRIIPKLEINENLTSNWSINTNFNYQKRSNIKLKQATSDFILKIAKIIPEGVLIYFPSYGLLKEYYNYLTEKNYIKLIKDYKEIYIEKSNYSVNLIHNFRKDCKLKGGIFFLVFNGKFSEGIDFKDEMSRAILIFGIPYPNFKDKKIQSKIETLNELAKKENNRTSGDIWYQEQAMLSINQTIGRILRHPKDFGNVFLIDERYSNNLYLKRLSGWFKNFVKISKSNNELVNDIKKFFKNKISYNIKNEYNNFKKKEKNSNLANNDLEIETKNKNLLNFFPKKIELDENTLKINENILKTNENILKTNENIIKTNENIIKTNENNIEQKDLIDEKLNLINQIINNDKLDIENEKLKQITKLENEINICPKCFLDYSKDVKFLITNCYHIACEKCWIKSLEIKLQCIICKKRVRIKNLKEFKK